MHADDNAAAPLRDSLALAELRRALREAEAGPELRPIGGYLPEGGPATEPTAWATVALARAGRGEEARVGAEWLADLQQPDGSVGVAPGETSPGWTTAPAMLAWSVVDPTGYADRIRRGAEWAVAQQAWTEPRNEILGHNTELEGWSWAPATHSWLEPTAMFVVALREAGMARRPRRREAIRLLVDRLLDDGGANYGNTTVLGQKLLRHLHPSGVVMWALGGERLVDPRVARTLVYLESASAKPTGVASLAWAVRGLAAHGAVAASACAALAAALPRAVGSGCQHKLALWTIAAQEAVASIERGAPEGATP